MENLTSKNPHNPVVETECEREIASGEHCMNRTEVNVNGGWRKETASRLKWT